MTVAQLVIGLFNSTAWPVFSYHQLVYLTEPFEIPPDTLRPALLRMKREGMLESQRHQGKTHYRLSLKAKNISQNISSPFKDLNWKLWDGSWRGVLFKRGGNAKQRAPLRKKLTAYRLVCLEKGFWIRPYLAQDELQSGFDQNFLSEEVRLMRFFPDHPLFFQQVRDLWKTQELNQIYQSLLEELQKETFTSLSSKTALIKRMDWGHRVISQLCLNPQLPKEFLPKDWAATELRTHYFELDKKLKIQAHPYLEKLKDC